MLDDNHLLTLPNGERIAFGDNVNFLFETHDLRFASPATVESRFYFYAIEFDRISLPPLKGVPLGMIFLSEDDIDVRRVCDKWLKAQASYISVP